MRYFRLGNNWFVRFLLDEQGFKTHFKTIYAPLPIENPQKRLKTGQKRPFLHHFTSGYEPDVISNRLFFVVIFRREDAYNAYIKIKRGTEHRNIQHLFCFDFKITT